jgi:putative Mg2+ transporter-C (MgtC) family protein
MHFNLHDFDLFLRIIIAAVLGALFGLERDIHGRSAGIRTNLLVSVGSSLFVIISSEVALFYGLNNSDPTRIAAQVVTGIGFLGAGTIIREGFTVKGLTTAACLWLVAAIGMACGYGYYTVAVFTTILSITLILVLQKFENILKKNTYRTITITASIDTDVDKIISHINKKKIRIDYFDFEKNYKTKSVIMRLSLNIHSKGIIDNYFNIIMKTLEEDKIKISAVKWDHKE